MNPEPCLDLCQVLENSKVAADTYLLRLLAPSISTMARPGQFVMVQTGGAPDLGAGPLLKRPLSLHRIGPNDEISLLYKTVGAGTRLLASAPPGRSLEILGPLGRGFRIPDKAPLVYLVAGGIGLAPLYALAEKMRHRTIKILFYGARTKNELAPNAYLRKMTKSFVLTTDDGSAGRKGLVVTPLAEALAIEPAPVFACGPRAMLAETTALAIKAGVPVQVSVEAYMACGMGACLGCAVPAPGGGYRPACVDGPVFDGGEVAW